MTRALIVLTLGAGMAWAQQPPLGNRNPEQLRDDEVARGIRAAVDEALLQALRAEESADQAKLAGLRTRYMDTYPDVRQLKLQIADLHLRISRAESLAGNTAGPKLALPERWWKNPATAQYVGLTADQQKKMDDVFQQYKLKLIDLNGALEKEEVTLQPLVSAEPLDEARITAQIDRVAQARAELEKANGRMLLGIRKLLNPDQWTKLNTGFSLTAPVQK